MNEWAYNAHKIPLSKSFFFTQALSCYVWRVGPWGKMEIRKQFTWKIFASFLMPFVAKLIWSRERLLESHTKRQSYFCPKNGWHLCQHLSWSSWDNFPTRKLNEFHWCEIIMTISLFIEPNWSFTAVFFTLNFISLIQNWCQKVFVAYFIGENWFGLKLTVIRLIGPFLVHVGLAFTSFLPWKHTKYLRMILISPLFKRTNTFFFCRIESARFNVLIEIPTPNKSSALCSEHTLFIVYILVKVLSWTVSADCVQHASAVGTQWFTIAMVYVAEPHYLIFPMKWTRETST